MSSVKTWIPHCLRNNDAVHQWGMRENNKLAQNACDLVDHPFTGCGHDSGEVHVQCPRRVPISPDDDSAMKFPNFHPIFSVNPLDPFWVMGIIKAWSEEVNSTSNLIHLPLSMV